MQKTAVITGGSRGIGSAVSSLFAKNGYNVIIGYKENEEKASDLKNQLLSEGCSAHIFKADIKQSNEAKALIDFAIDTFGKIDVLVNNAGISKPMLLTDITDSDWESMININLSGVFYCCREAATHMIKRKQGVIINVSSIWGVAGASLESHYSASKAGIIGFTQALAKELGPSNIRVNSVSPGVVNTDMNKHLSDCDLNGLANATALCRIGEPIEIAKPILFLASDDASFITGQNLIIDGGFLG
jgi:3-oxoacyl-[acyl-carrier protein] reductase